MTDENNETTMSKRVDLIQPGGFVAGKNLVTTQVASVTAAANQILIDIRASAVQPLDWKMAEHGFFLAKSGGATALGCDIAGTVVAVSSSSSSSSSPEQESSWQVGQRVVTYLGGDKSQFGVTRPGFADTTAVDADLVFAVPQGMTLAQAAALPVGGITATALLNDLDDDNNNNSNSNNNNKSNRWVLVWGASSSVGWSAISLATQQRGYKVIAVASPKHASSLTKLGAAAVVDYKQSAETVLTAVKDTLQGATLHGALDCIGTADSFAGAAALVQACGNKGTISTVNGQGTPQPPAGITKKAVVVGSLQDAATRDLVKSSMPAVLKYCRPPKLRLVQGSISAETVEKAFKMQKQGMSGEKVVIEWKKQ